MELDELKMESKRIFREGISVGEWFDNVQQICGCDKPHILLVLAPFPYVEISENTLRLYGNDLFQSVTPIIICGQCVQILNRYFFFTNSIDASVFKLYWQPPIKIKKNNEF